MKVVPGRKVTLDGELLHVYGTLHNSLWQGHPFCEIGKPQGVRQLFSTHVNTLTRLPETTPWERFNMFG